MSNYTDDIFYDRDDGARRERRERRRQERERREKQVQSAKAQRRRRRRRIAAFVSFVVLFAVIAVAVVNALHVRDLMEQKAQAETRLTELQAIIDEKNAELSHVDSPEYLEQQARSQLGMIYDGEILYKLRGTNEYTAPEPEPEEPAEENPAKPR